MTTSFTPTGLSNLASTPLTGNRMGRSPAPATWYEALADAWGKTLDGQAARLEQQADGISQGTDNPSQVVKLTAEAMRMTFLTNASSTTIDSVGKALETMARKG
ncbi:MAG: hypothetical protein ACK4TG_08725 [Thermaurantiacus sp.]